MIINDRHDGREIFRQIHWIWRPIGLVLALYAAISLVEFMLWDAQRLPNAGTIGAEQAQFKAPSTEPGFVTVLTVAEGSPLDRAGVVAGDKLRFDPVFDYLRYRRAGETASFVVDHGGHRSEKTVVAVARQGPPDWESVRFYLGNLVPTIFGAFIIWRSRRRSVALLLGAALVTFGPPSLSAMMWEGGRSTFLFSATVNRACIISVAVFLLAFAMKFVDQTVTPIGRRQWIAYGVYAGLNLVLLIAWCISSYTSTSLPLVGDATLLVSLVGYVGFAATLRYLMLGWQRSEKTQRERFALFLAGVAALVVSQILSFIVFLQLDLAFTASHPLLIVAELLSGVVAPLLLTHAILRHRIFNLGFILNRTIVFGAVSALLLVAFGLIEWGVEHIVKFEGREQNALVDAAIALGVYLIFHRFRHTTEQGVERFFFRDWHANEARFRRSILHAGFITEPAPLMAAATSAFHLFSSGAQTSIYIKDDAGNYAPADRTEILDRNSPMVVAMRAEPVAHRLDARDPAWADLALPMTLRNDLLGFVLLGPKGGESDYRADEVEVLMWAAHQIGLDLHALTVDRLEAVIRAQDQQIKVLQASRKISSAAAS